MCEDGATVAATPTFSAAGCPTKENFEHNGNTIKYLKSPSVERNAGDFQTFLFGPPKQMKQQMKLKDADESENRLT